MTEIRNAEVANAQSSNSILSPLVGAQQQAPMQQPVVDTGGVVPQQGQQIAQDLSSDLYGSGFVEGGENQSGRLSQELFNYDQQLEKGYSPFPKKDFYVENPADLYKAGSSYAGGMGQVSGSVGKAVSGAELAYNNAVSAVLDKFTNFYKMKQDEEEARKDREERIDKEKREERMALINMVGGEYTDSSGKTWNLPGPKGTQGDRDRSRVETMIQQDVKNGMVPEELLVKYGEQTDFPTIMGIYNGTYGGGEASQWGAAQRPTGDYKQIYDDAISSAEAEGLPTEDVINDYRANLALAKENFPNEDETVLKVKAKIATIDATSDQDREVVANLLNDLVPNINEEEQSKNWFQRTFGGDKSIETSQEVQNLAPNLKPGQQSSNDAVYSPEPGVVNIDPKLLVKNTAPSVGEFFKRGFIPGYQAGLEEN